MKKTSVFFAGLAAIVLVSAASTFGQERKVEGNAIATGVAFQGPPQGEIGANNTFTFVSSEFSFDKLVKGAPYSAQAVTGMTQILGDGNRIVNTSSAAVYRDGEGRTRREQTLRTIGNFSVSGEPLKSIVINDSVNGVAYVLEPHSRTAQKILAARVDGGPGAGIRMSAAGGGNFTLSTATNGAVTLQRGMAEAKMVEEKEQTGFRRDNFTLSTATNGPVTLQRGTAEAKMVEEKERTGFRKEDLGTQTVEGVSAVGTRTTITIPAGQIGNERAIEIVDEHWYSPELQTMVMTRHADPRSGESVYRLTNINRAEPDHSLFEVPGDYTVREQEPTRFRFDRPAKPEQQW